MTVIDEYYRVEPSKRCYSYGAIRSKNYPTDLSRLGLNGRVDYADRDTIEQWFQTLTMRVHRFRHSWVGGRSSVRRWLVHFVHPYDAQRPHQSLDDRTPAEGTN